VPARVELQGTRDVKLAAAKMRAAGRGDLVKKMTREMKAAAKPAQVAVQREVQSLASKGSRGGGGQARRAFDVARSRKASERVRQRAAVRRGLRQTIARATRIEASTSKRSARLRIRVNRQMLPPSQRKLPRLLNRGKWRHPVHGSPQWVDQTATPPGFFDRPAARYAPGIRRGALVAVNDVLRELAN